ncbi:MAG TPA: hypothetical protein VFV08_02055, partial [Puia sp.]|nr:hypothetical protein [Puia sp.]
EDIKKIAVDLDAIYRELRKKDIMTAEFHRQFGYFSTLQNAAEDALERATRARSETTAVFYSNNIKKAKSNTDIIKTIKKEYEGGEQNPPI